MPCLCPHLRGAEACLPPRREHHSTQGQNSRRGRIMKRIIPVAAGLLATVTLAAAAFAGPGYDADGKIIIPDNMDRWPTVATTYALSYEGDGGTTLNTVRLDP